MKLKQIIPWGRSFKEYQLMFNLDATDLNKRILGCGDGPASFNQEMHELGRRVISIDPLYQFSQGQIRQRIADCYGLVLAEVGKHRDRFLWDYFQTVQGLGHQRQATMDQFLTDYNLGKSQGRYLVQSLPNLTFSDRSFDLALCSHLLFLYSQQLDEAFHLNSILELLRVASEVRIFPLLDLDGNPSPHVVPIVATLTSHHYHVTIEQVNYEFQQGGNQMLRITA